MCPRSCPASTRIASFRLSVVSSSMVVVLGLKGWVCGNNHSSRPRPPPQNVRKLRYVIVAPRVARKPLSGARALLQVPHPERAPGLPLFLIYHAEFLLVELPASQQATGLRDRVCEMERLPPTLLSSVKAAAASSVRDC